MNLNVLISSIYFNSVKKHDQNFSPKIWKYYYYCVRYNNISFYFRNDSKYNWVNSIAWVFYLHLRVCSKHVSNYALHKTGINEENQFQKKFKLIEN